MADNESQWPAQYPRDDWPAAAPGPAGADDGQPAAAQPRPTLPYAPPTGYQAQVPPAGYQIPPAGYPVPPAGYPVPPAGYPVPPAGYPVAHGHGGYQTQMNPAMRAASADRERAVDVLKAGFTEGRLTQD